MKPETRIVKAIQRWFLFADLDAYNMLKLHGNVFQRSGEPDLIGGVRVGSKVVHFAVEVKLPGRSADPVQLERLRRWEAVGFVTGVVTSVEDFVFLITTALED